MTPEASDLRERVGYALFYLGGLADDEPICPTDCSDLGLNVGDLKALLALLEGEEPMAWRIQRDGWDFVTDSREEMSWYENDPSFRVTPLYARAAPPRGATPEESEGG